MGKYHDAAQGRAAKPTLKEQGFYHTPAWRRLRRMALNRDRSICQACMRKKGVVVVATEVHHVVPVDVAPERALDLSNLECLCWDCHEETKKRRGRAGAHAPRGVRVLDPNETSPPTREG